MKNRLKYVGKQLIRVISLLAATCALTLVLVNASPIDPVQQYVNAIPGISAEQREEIADYWGVNDPPAERFLSWAGALLHGDMGESLIYRRPVADIIREKFANSLALMLTAWVLTGILGLLCGVIMGKYAGRPVDRLLKKVCLFMSSVPTYWFGLLMLLLFAVQLKWFPVGFSTPIGVTAAEVRLGQRIRHLVLPSLTLALTGFSELALHTRQKLMDVMESDYVLFARARGESEWKIVRRHGLRNILLPVVTLQFASFSELFGGSVLAENVFSYPGLGQAVAQAGLQSDLPLLLGITLFSSLFVFAGNFAVDVLYGCIHPQLREGEDYEP